MRFPNLYELVQIAQYLYPCGSSRYPRGQDLQICKFLHNDHAKLMELEQAFVTLQSSFDTLKSACIEVYKSHAELFAETWNKAKPDIERVDGDVEKLFDGYVLSSE